jgi:hypothetical protein
MCLLQKTLAASVAVAPVSVLAQAFETEYPLSFVNGITAVLSALFPLLVAIAVFYFVWGVVMFIAKAGDEKARAEGKQRMVWGIASLFIILSVWGFVAVLQGILRFGNEAPSSYSPQSTF